MYFTVGFMTHSHQSFITRVISMTFGRPAMISKASSEAVPLPAAVDEESLVKLGSGNRRWLRQFMLVLCTLIGPLTLHLPAAVHLYWVTSTVTHLSLRLLLDVFMPSTKVVATPCKAIELPVIRPTITKKGPAKTIAGNTGE